MKNVVFDTDYCVKRQKQETWLPRMSSDDVRSLSQTNFVLQIS